MTTEHGPDLQKEAREEEWKKVAEELYRCTEKAGRALLYFQDTEKRVTVENEIHRLVEVALKNKEIPFQWYSKFAQRYEEVK